MPSKRSSCINIALHLHRRSQTLFSNLLFSWLLYRGRPLISKLVPESDHHESRTLASTPSSNSTGLRTTIPRNNSQHLIETPPFNKKQTRNRRNAIDEANLPERKRKIRKLNSTRVDWATRGRWTINWKSGHQAG